MTFYHSLFCTVFRIVEFSVSGFQLQSTENKSYSTVLVISLLQNLNAFSLFQGRTSYFFWILFIVFFGINYLYFFKVKGFGKSAVRLCATKPESSRGKVFAVLYVVLTFVIFIVTKDGAIIKILE